MENPFGDVIIKKMMFEDNGDGTTIATFVIEDGEETHEIQALVEMRLNDMAGALTPEMMDQAVANISGSIVEIPNSPPEA